MSRCVPRYLRIECPNGEIHHVELTGGQYRQGDVNVWVAHNLGKVSKTSAVCSLSFLLFCGVWRWGKWRRLPHNSLLAHNLEPGCWRVSFMDSLGISASLLSWTSTIAVASGQMTFVFSLAFMGMCPGPPARLGNLRDCPDLGHVSVHLMSNLALTAGQHLLPWIGLDLSIRPPIFGGSLLAPAFCA
jgi:hypothetical protein